ncbi:MucBP domain-containing protein [Aerococcaceae bacterium zg-BR9]|uniref:MucBP domain-containing protein n=1 Tax=Aerococcaceae bacterium zg-1292 TaxID=2774330 RepID=UPI004064C8C1|nr:MucBP domain-containing protein [Aerococcaceae bacterium zg-BR9]
MFLKKKQRFSLRKYKIGVCSVLLGTTFVTGAHQVSAEEAGLNEAVSSTTERVEEVSEAEPLSNSETTTEEVAPEAPTTTEATTSVVAEEVIAEPETSSGVRHLFVNNKVTVLDPHNLTKGEKANIEAVVRKTNHLTSDYVVFVAQDGSVEVLKEGEEIGRLSSEEVVEVLTARKPEAESMTETPDVTEAPEAPETTEASAENGTIGTAGVISEVKPASTETSPAATEPVTPEVPEPAEKTTPTVDIEALRAEKVALLNTYSLLTPTVKGEFLTRFQQAVDAAALNAIAEEARKIQKREGATKRSDFAITGRAYYPKPLGLMAQESLQQEPIPQAILAAAEENEEKAPTEGRMVTPTKTTVTSMHQGLSATPTVQNYGKTTIDFSFGKQQLHKGDYFYVETQDSPVPLPSTFRMKAEGTTGDGKVIATVERVGYESDFVKGSNSEDESRFDLKNDQSLTTMKIKYKVTFTEAVEGLEDVKATVSGDTSKQTLGAIANRPTQFKVNVNDQTVYTGSYVVPKWDDANANGFKRSPFNTGQQGKVTEGLKYTKTEELDEKGKKVNTVNLEYGDGNRSKTEYDDGVENKKMHSYVTMEATVYDYRTQNKESNVPFLTDTKSDGLVQLTGQVGGMPNGFLMTIESPESEDKNRFTWDKEKLLMNDKLPVYYMPFEDVDTMKQHPNSNDKKLFVTPKDMYYTIKEVSEDGRKITLQFHGDYTRPGRIVSSFKNPMEEPEGKSSRLGLKFDSPSWKDVSGLDNAKLTVSHLDGKSLENYEFKATSKKDSSIGENSITQRGQDALTSKAVKLNYDATATGVPVTAKNPEQIDKGTVIVRYVDENGKTIQTERTVIKDYVVKLQDGTKTKYNTVTKEYRPEEIEVGDKKYRLVPASTLENTYPIGTVSDQGNLTKSALPNIVASTDPTGANPEGELTQGTKYITYVYKEVLPIKKTGKVIVKYEDTEGKEIADSVEDTPESPVGTPYETHDKRRDSIVSKTDKKTYYLVGVKEDKVPESGNVKEGETVVTYVYQKAGSVEVKYVDENGTEISPTRMPYEDVKPGTEYNVTTTDLRPTEITTSENKIYKIVPAGEYKTGKVDGHGRKIDSDEVDGKVESGKTKSITYVYKEVKEEVPAPEPKGKVVVHYVDTEGNIIKEKYEDTPEVESGSAYDATESHDGKDEKPDTLVDKDGKLYHFNRVSQSNYVGINKIAPIDETNKVGEEKGTVSPGTTHVIYVYQ